MPIDRTVDWERIKRCLAVLHRDARSFLSRAVLIGGAACWFYRIQLRHAADPDFPVPELAPQTEAQWLSKDLDFTGIFSGDALLLMPKNLLRDADGVTHIEVEGVRLGFAQVGLTIDPEEAMATAEVATFQAGEQRVEFLVADPVTLYREKQALSERRGGPHDALHFSLLQSYLAWRLTRTVEQFLAAEGQLPATEARAQAAFFSTLKTKAPELLRDTRFLRRVRSHPRHAMPVAAILFRQLGLSLASESANG